jgi:hypothetical protein
MTTPDPRTSVLLKHRHCRLTELAAAIRQAVPFAQVVHSENAFDPGAAISIKLSNGIELSAGVDEALPDALFEVVRFRGTPGAALFSFEKVASEASVMAGRLTLEQAVARVLQYASLPRA